MCAAVAALIACSCVIGDDECLSTSVWVHFGRDGLSVFVSLDHPVRLPLDEDDALYVMSMSSCPCRGELVRVGDYWQYPEDGQGSGCSIRINVWTGEVECYMD